MKQTSGQQATTPNRQDQNQKEKRNSVSQGGLTSVKPLSAQHGNNKSSNSGVLELAQMFNLNGNDGNNAQIYINRYAHDYQYHDDNDEKLKLILSPFFLHWLELEHKGVRLPFLVERLLKHLANMEQLTISRAHDKNNVILTQRNAQNLIAQNIITPHTQGVNSWNQDQRGVFYLANQQSNVQNPESIIEQRQNMGFIASDTMGIANPNNDRSISPNAQSNNTQRQISGLFPSILNVVWNVMSKAPSNTQQQPVIPKLPPVVSGGDTLRIMTV
jgi:hypothetical protein